ncbi:hypothetical protein O3P69_004713 [Scylla paramamosain]|uniref:Uncharacterized protein n=2 Tax=Scylla paramamosain TaxID=85552 RepID=A0AAW0UBL6_SCYPA
MDLEGGEDSGGAGGLLALSPTGLTHSHLTLGRREAGVVTLQEGTPGEPLLLCPMDEDGVGAGAALPPEAAITYATLDAGEDFVLQAGGNAVAPRWKDATEGQLVVVGEAGSGEPITYIYIKGEGEGEEGDKDGVEGHTITLNAADGSALHTLPAPYASHPYGDLVLVGPPATQEDATLEAMAGEGEEGEGVQPEKRVLLLSVGHLKMEDGAPTTMSDPDPAEEEVPELETSAAPLKVVRGRRTEQQRRQQQEQASGEVLQEEEDDGSTFEVRLATRDSMLPPRRVRRSAPAGNMSCPACEARFRSSRQYHTHLQSHRGPDAWHCPVCRHPCDTAAALRTHRAAAHSTARPFPCPSCPLAFPKSLVLEDHIRSVHNKERPYPCSLCSKAFYRPYDLKMHLNLHLGIKTKVCDVCGRQFSHSSNLIRHQCLHTGVKPYVCSICGKRFKQVTLLHKHHMIHQEGRCPLCPTPVPTATATALRRHYRLEHKKTITLKEASRVLRGQRGPAPRCFYCRVCGAQFSVKADLKAHEEEAHPGDGHHHCASCGRVFPMSEVKTHACLSPEEHRNTMNLLHLRAHQTTTRDSTATTTTITTAAATTTTTTATSQDGSSTTLILREDAVPVQEGEVEEEEEYLVVYITPEGESMSYVMKKGNRPWQDQVLQVDAPGEPLGVEDALPHPEDTIMINVHHQDTDNTLLLTPGEAQTPAPPEPLVDDTPPLPLHTIKLEPQGGEEEPLESLAAPDKSLLPLVTLTIPKTEVEVPVQRLKEIPIKSEVMDEEEEDEEEEVDNGKKDTTTSVPKKLVGGGGGRGGGEKQGNEKGHLVCCDCGKTFNKQWNFQQHLATHNASLHRYKCDKCGLTFAYRSTLNKHMDHHNPTPQIHQCQQCPKTYKCLASLKQHHKRDHERRRPYACEMCSKDFFSKSDFKYHMRLHKREHPYMCFTCGQKFSHVSHLHRHERVHTGERPHKCPFCPKTFIQHGTLRIHLKKHEKQDPDLETTTDPSQQQANTTMPTDDTFSDTANLTLKLAMTEGAETLDDTTLLSKDAGGDLLGIHGEEGITLGHDTGNVESTLGQDTLPSGTMILTEGGQGPGQFSGGHTAMMAGVDGECIAIFVQEELT